MCKGETLYDLHMQICKRSTGLLTGEVFEYQQFIGVIHHQFKRFSERNLKSGNRLKIKHAFLCFMILKLRQTFLHAPKKVFYKIQLKLYGQYRQINFFLLFADLNSHPADCQWIKKNSQIIKLHRL